MPWDTGLNMLKETERLYETAGTFNSIEKGDRVAIKIHVGELGTPYYVQPFFVHQIFQKVKDAGGKPFLTDTSTYYKGHRNDALDHMETSVINGFNFAPFIISDGLIGENQITVRTKGLLEDVEVAGAIAKADAMIVVSHAKGHRITGYGGAIKNLGMGCTSLAGKLRQHRTVGLEIDEGQCTGCGTCKEVCERNLPEIVDGKAVIDSPSCRRCPVCARNCPAGAIRLVGMEKLPMAIASAAYGVLSTFDQKKVSYVSFAKDITQYCDCLANPGKVVMDDIGVLASDSPVSIDAAFLKMAGYHITHDCDLDCMIQVKEARALGIEGDINPETEKI